MWASALLCDDAREKQRNRFSSASPRQETRPMTKLASAAHLLLLLTAVSLLAACGRIQPGADQRRRRRRQRLPEPTPTAPPAGRATPPRTCACPCRAAPERRADCSSPTPALPDRHPHLRAVHDQQPVSERRGVLQLRVRRLLRQRRGVRAGAHLLLSALHRHPPSTPPTAALLRRRLRALQRGGGRVRERVVRDRGLACSASPTATSSCPTAARSTPATTPETAAAAARSAPRATPARAAPAWAAAAAARRARGASCAAAPSAPTSGPDNNNCGGCGIACGAVPNGTADCAKSSCQIVACNLGFADCDGQETDGCEVDTNTVDRFGNCGTCGHGCALSESCVMGTCQPGSCALSGCGGALTCCKDACVDTGSSLQNCGAAAATPARPAPRRARAAPAATRNTCSMMVCPSPLSLCNNTCVDESNDPANCGGCDIACSARLHPA